MERQNSNSHGKKTPQSQSDLSTPTPSVNSSQPRKFLKIETDLPQLTPGIPQYIIDYTLLRKMIRNNQLHKYIINGIVMYFPHKQPNKPQKEFIKKMFESLENGLKKEETQKLDRIKDRHKMQREEQVRERLYDNNLLIESSTGTGKTLALLYSSMSWAEHKYIEKMEDLLEQLEKKEITEKYFEYQTIVARRKIIYSSRAHSQLSQISKQLEKTPFRPNMLIFGGKQKLCINEVVKFQNKIAKQSQKFQEWQKKCGSANGYQRMFKGKKNSQYMNAVDECKNTIFDLLTQLSVNQQRMDQKMLQDYKKASQIVRKYLYKQRNTEEARNMRDFLGIGQNQQRQQNNANNVNQRRQGNQDIIERRDNQRRRQQEERLKNLRKSNMSRYDIINSFARQQNRPREDQDNQSDSQDQNNQQTHNINQSISKKQTKGQKRQFKQSQNSNTNPTIAYNKKYQKEQSTGKKQASRKTRMQQDEPESDSEERKQIPGNNYSSQNQNQQNIQSQPQPQQPSGGNSSLPQSLKQRLLALQKLHFLISKVYPIYTGISSKGKIDDIDSQYKHLLSMESRCPHYHPIVKGESSVDKQFFGSMKRRLLNNETLGYEASQNKPTLCPHFYPQRVRYLGTLYLMPYNYLLMQRIQQRTGDLFRNAIVIFDEGHNVASTACSGYSLKMLPQYFGDALKNIHEKDQDEDDKKLNRKKKKDKNADQEEEEEEKLNITADDLQQQAEMTRKYLKEKRKNLGKKLNDDPNGTSYFEDDDNNEQVPNQQQKRQNQGSRNSRERQLATMLTAIIQNHLLNFQNFFRSQIQDSEFKFTTEYRQKYILPGINFSSYYMTEFKQYNNEIKADNMNYIRKLLFNDPTLTKENMKQILLELMKDLQSMIEIKIEKINEIEEHNKTHAQKNHKRIYYFKIVQLQYCYKKIYKLFFNQSYNKKFYLRLAQSKMKLKDGKMKYNGSVEIICLSPEFAMQTLQTICPLSMILTSGTLKPTNLLKRELAIEFTDGGHAGHVINKKNTCIRIVRRFVDVKKSSKNQVIDDQSQVATINSDFYDINGKPIQSNLNKLIRTLIEIIQKIPNGVLLIFSSKAKVKSIEKFLKGTTGRHLLKQLQEIKPFVGFETGNDVMKNVDKFKKNAVDRGALMFCVCRGKLSQGIDFKDKLCRGVIFIGVPVLPQSDPQIVQKTKYMGNFHPQYKETHTYVEVAKAINQSLGRVVRHQFDYGSIILLDDRYYDLRYPTQRTVSNLSDWIRDQCQLAKSVQDLKRELGLFFIKSKEYYSHYYDEQKVEIDQVQKNYAQELRPIINGHILPVIPQEQLFQYARRNLMQDQLLRFEQPIDQEVILQSIESQLPAQISYDQLQISVVSKGFTLHHIESDGNCLFRTLSLLITRNTQQRYALFRAKIMDQISRNKNQLMENIVVDWRFSHPLDNDLTDDAIFDKYLAHFRRDKIYGEGREFKIASKLYSVGFMIHTKEGTHSIQCCEDIRLTQYNILHVAFLKIDDNENKNHYMALKPNGSSFINPSFNKNNYIIEINKENTKNGKALVM